MRIRRRFFDSQFEQEELRIDMVPMIDTIFLILTVLLYGMLNMTVHRGIKVDIPQAMAAEKQRADLLTFTITADGAIYMNKERVEKSSLPSRIATYHTANPLIGEVYLNADQAADYGIVIAVMDACRLAGLTRISLETVPAR